MQKTRNLFTFSEKKITYEEGGKLTSGYVTNLPFNLFKEAQKGYA